MPQAGGAGAAGFRPVVSQSWTVRPGSVYAFQVKPSDIDYDKREQTISAYCTLWAVLARGAPDMRNLGFRIAYAPTVDNRYVYTAPNGKKVEIEEVKFLNILSHSRTFPTSRSRRSRWRRQSRKRGNR